VDMCPAYGRPVGDTWKAALDDGEIPLRTDLSGSRRG
jgi:hypothetical protein